MGWTLCLFCYSWGRRPRLGSPGPGPRNLDRLAEKQLLQLPSLGFSGRLAILATMVRTTVALLSQQARAGSHEPSPPQPVPVETVADLHRCLQGLPAWAGQGGLKTELLGTVEVAGVGSSQLRTFFPTSDSTEGWWELEEGTEI